ncbi:MAG TPA: outer membrane beta-barrel protein [Burkholderiales bacterium]|nr:outer membrane beta-barrel protein [Burkholderiales bacterium]
MRSRTLLVILLTFAAGSAWAQEVRRAGKGEFYVSPIFTDGKTYNFSGGSTARTDTGFGLAMGYTFNLDDKVSIGGEFSWGEADYRATVQPGPGNSLGIQSINASIETWTVRFLGNYNFSRNAFTPFVSGGLGWTSIDTNIPTGLPQNVCWWYPYWGQYCGTYVPTATTTKFSYNANVGLRYDFGNTGFVRGQVGWQWVDFGGSYGSDQWTQYRLDFGAKF